MYNLKRESSTEDGHKSYSSTSKDGTTVQTDVTALTTTDSMISTNEYSTSEQDITTSMHSKLITSKDAHTYCKLESENVVIMVSNYSKIHQAGTSVKSYVTLVWGCGIWQFLFHSFLLKF